MKTLNLIVVLLFFQTFLDGKVVAQTQLIDTSSYDKFTYLDYPVISGDGKYLAYDIKKGPEHGVLVKRVVQSTFDDWKIEVPIGKGYFRFTADGKYCLFITLKDSLGIIDLKRKSIKYLPGVADFSISDEGSGEWLVYQLVKQETEIFMVNLKTGNTRSFSNVFNYKLSPDGKAILIIEKSKKDTSDHYSVARINLVNGEKQVTELGVDLENFIADFKHSQFAFRKGNAIWYYKLGKDKSVCLIPEATQHLVDALSLSAIGHFSQDGNCLFVDLKSLKEVKPGSEHRNVEVWSYTDAKIESRFEQTNNVYLGKIRLDDGKVIRLQNYLNESVMPAKGGSDSLYLAVRNRKNGSVWESHWNVKSQVVYALVDGSTGKRTPLDWLNDPNKQDPALSPSGKYVVFYDKKLGSYCSYDLKSEQIHNLTKGIRTSWGYQGEELDYALKRGIAGWLPNDKALLVYDSHDIWRLDPSGQKVAINLTNGYGLSHHIVFDRAFNAYGEWVIKDEKLLLTALNTETKENGFFSTLLQKASDPKLLTMGPFIYTANGRNMFHSYVFEPVKAARTELYLVKRMASNDAPNYFSTTDFKTFKRLTNNQPQKDYNWYTTELHSWKSPDGRSLQGILYKPGNFDSKKKYPVLFHYYERVSDGLNAYLRPGYSVGALDIPSYVSNGCLVFCPDIYYRIGDPMQGTYDAVVSAAEYVSGLPFVNPGKMGIQGQSFGGIQTNYLVTHTDLFAAACSSSGVGDWISAYGSLGLNELGPLQRMYEVSQNRMGSTLWENLGGFIKNSPVFHADKVRTPLLIKHGEKDEICLYPNVMEFFLGLRRLGKKVWMLAYPEGVHTLHGDDAKDYTLRMQQFFDHYLKDKPAPLWMLDHGEKYRSSKSGLELDQTGSTPGSGLLIPEEQKMIDSLIKRKTTTITLQ